MNYIELVNNFWALSETEDLSASDQSTYFALVNYCNKLNWLNPFVCHWDILIQYSKTSKNTFYSSMDKLTKVGLIKYEKGVKNSLKPKVFVLNIKNRKGTAPRTEKEQQEEQKGNIYKHINKETIKLINDNVFLVEENLKTWIDNHFLDNPKKGDEKEIGFQFENFWEIYPNKIARAKCKEKFDVLSGDEKQKISETINDFVKHKPFPEYHHPNPLTYLSQKRWEDVIPKVSNTSNQIGVKKDFGKTNQLQSLNGFVSKTQQSY